jgi:drug/metabolite transporter (DMT)-like permease
LIRKNLNIKELIKPGLILGPLLAIHWVTMFESIELNSIAVGIGLVFSYPLFVLLLEFLRGNKPKTYQVFLISIGFIGLYFLLDISNINSLEGIFYGLISAISLSLIIIIGEKFSSQLGGLKVAFSQLLVASIILIKFTYESREWLIDNLAVSIFLGFFLTGVGLTTYWYVVKIIKPIAVSTISYLEPVTGVILGAFLLNENLSSKQLIGFVLVLLVGIGQIYFDSKINSASKV